MSEPTYELSALRELAQGHPLLRHPFITRSRAGVVTLDEVRVLATQMYQFSREFGRILAAVFFSCPEETARQVIAENLLEELGDTNLRLTHAGLLRQFTRALNISDSDLDGSGVRPETAALIRTYLALPGKYGFLGALGAVGFASEGIVSELYTQLQTGIKGTSPPMRASAMAIFEVQVSPATAQIRKLASLVEHGLDSPESLEQVTGAIAEAMDARMQFFDGVVREARESTLGMLFDTYVRMQDIIRSRDLILSEDLLQPPQAHYSTKALIHPGS